MQTANIETVMIKYRCKIQALNKDSNTDTNCLKKDVKS